MSDYEERFADEKRRFSGALAEFVDGAGRLVAAADGQWTVKGFIDLYRNVYTIGHDTKVVSKLLEIHVLPGIL